MKVVILAGGFGTRISEESRIKPKPMIEIGGKPILWHIMKIYSYHGLNEFIICLGYKGYLIKEYFSNYFLHNSDVTIDIQRNKTEIHHSTNEPWKITLVETGEKTMTGGRLKKVSNYLDSSDFCFTYGDGLGDIDISALIKFHKVNGNDATVTAVRPEGRFGTIKINKNNIAESFDEKIEDSNSWINAGFFVLSPKVLDKIDCDETVWEEGPLKNLSESENLSVYKHDGFWKPMDTLRDKELLERLILENEAPWIRW